MGSASRYTIEAELAHGGMGVVYRAVDTTTGKPVALKRLRDGASPRVEALFRREYHTLAQLQHPRIIQAFEYGRDERGPWYTMELLSGQDLRELAPLPLSVACAHLRDVASALALVHARRLLHRDISPRNVRVLENGRAKLLDFGAMMPFGVASELVGTPPAIPPEAMDRLELDQRADLYGLGALAYWLVTNRHAYPAETPDQLRALWQKGPPPPPSALTSGISSEFDDLVLGLLSPDPVARPRSAAAVIEQLVRIADVEPESDVEAATSYLIHPPVVDRTEITDAITTRLRKLLDGRGGLMSIEGAAGLGKSRLLRDVALEARLAGVAVAVIDAAQHQGPLAVVRAVVTGLRRTHPNLVAAAATPHAEWLGHLLPELADPTGLAQLPQDLGEQRTRLHGAIAALLADVGATTPLFIGIDAAEVADDGSLGILGALPLADPAPPVMVALAISARPTSEVSVLGSLLARSDHTVLRPLSETGTSALAAALFGDVDNVSRLGHWLHERAGGNPAHCIALAQRLVDAGELQLREGAWVIPDHGLGSAVPLADTASVLDARLASLSEDARHLAERLCVERVPVALVECIALSELPDDRAFVALGELVETGILLATEDRYRFEHPGLRTHVRAGLSVDQLHQAHLAAAAFRLADAPDDELVQVDAGWHLIQGGEALRGAEMIERGGRNLGVTVEGLVFAAPALEAAVAVYDEHDASPWVVLPMLSALTAAGWYVDHRYVRDHGDRTLELACQRVGLAAADRAQAWLGPGLGLKAGLIFAGVRHGVQKGQIRHPGMAEFERVFTYVVGSVGVLIGVSTTLWDGVQSRAVLARVQMLQHFPAGHVLRVMHDYTRCYALTAEGRIADAEPLALQILGYFRSSQAKAALDEMASAFAGGILIGLSVMAALRDDADVDHWARQLEGHNLTYYQAMGTQARFLHHLWRGEADQARHYLRQLEVHALQGGSLWQARVMASLATAGVAARCGDLPTLRREVAHLAAMAAEMPVLQVHARSYGACADLLDGQPEQAARALEALRDERGAWSTVDWRFLDCTRARAWMALGELDRAEAALRDAEEELGPDDTPYSFLSLDLVLTRAELALARGETREAAALYDARIRAADQHPSPLTLCRLHEGRARAALHEADEAGADTHTAAVARWAHQAQNALWLRRARRLALDTSRTFGRDADFATDEISVDTWHGTGAPMTSASSLFATPDPAPVRAATRDEA